MAAMCSFVLTYLKRIINFSLSFRKYFFFLRETMWWVRTYVCIHVNQKNLHIKRKHIVFSNNLNKQYICSTTACFIHYILWIYLQLWGGTWHKKKKKERKKTQKTMGYEDHQTWEIGWFAIGNQYKTQPCSTVKLSKFSISQQQYTQWQSIWSNKTMQQK